MIVCNSVLNKTSVEECVKPICRKQQIIYAFITIAACVLLIFLAHMITKDSSIGTRIVSFLIAGIGCLFIIITNAIRILKVPKKLANRMLEQIQTLHHTDCLVRKVEIHETHITSINEAETHDLHIEDLEKWYETPNYLVLVFKGSLSVFLDKNGIEGGTFEDVKVVLGKK